MNRERVRGAIGSGGSGDPVLGCNPALGQTVGYSPTTEEIAEMKAERERGLDLSIRQNAVGAALQIVTGMPNPKDVINDANFVELAQDIYIFLKGTN